MTTPDSNQNKGELAEVHRLPVRRPGDELETAGQALEGEVVDEAQWREIQKAKRAELNAAYLDTGRAVVRVTRTAITHDRTKATGRAVVRHGSYLLGGVAVVAKRAKD